MTNLIEAAARLRRLADPSPGRVIHALCVLGVPDALLAGPRESTALAGEVGADADALDRVLRAASALELVEREPDGWRLLPAGRLLCSGADGSLRAEFSDNDLYLLWSEFLASVRTGEPAYPRVFGAPIYQRLAANPEQRAAFHRHMYDRAVTMYGPLLDWPGWPAAGLLVDVGGGTGGLLSRLLPGRPELRAVLFDLPEVVRDSPLLADPELAARIQVCGGDLFTDPVPRGNVAVLGSVLHDFPDQRAVEILVACRTAVGGGGRVLLLDRILPAAGAHEGFFNDLLMLAACGGRERTLPQWRDLLDRAGLTLESSYTTPGTELSLLECRLSGEPPPPGQGW
jgi:hypothetical protein